MTKHILTEESELNSRVYCLISNVPFMELAYHLKHHVQLMLKRDKDLKWEKNRITYFAAIYRFYDEDRETNYALVKNKATEGVVSNEYIMFDAFLIETNYEGSFTLSKDIISRSDVVRYCIEIDPNTLKKQTQGILEIS